jgi:hypothetical protein
MEITSSKKVKLITSAGYYLISTEFDIVKEPLPTIRKFLIIVKNLGGFSSKLTSLYARSRLVSAKITVKQAFRLMQEKPDVVSIACQKCFLQDDGSFSNGVISKVKSYTIYYYNPIATIEPSLPVERLDVVWLNKKLHESQTTLPL